MKRSEIIEEGAADVHDTWVKTKHDQGITSRPTEDGIEQMVPYTELPEKIKDLDRNSVGAVVDFLIGRGLLVVEPE